MPVQKATHFDKTPSAIYHKTMVDKKAKDSIAVDAYSGYRDDEMSRSFIFAGEKIQVVEILEATVEETKERKRNRRFRLRGSDGYIHRISYAEATAAWSYVR